MAPSVPSSLSAAGKDHHLSSFYHGDEGRALDNAYLDFCKTVDSISRKILINQLRRQTVSWAENWLESQAQKVVISSIKHQLRASYQQSCLTSSLTIWLKLFERTSQERKVTSGVECHDSLKDRQVKGIITPVTPDLKKIRGGFKVEERCDQIVCEIVLDRKA